MALAEISLRMIDVLEFVLDLICDLLGAFDWIAILLPQTRVGRIALSIILALVALVIWRELR